MDAAPKIEFAPPCEADLATMEHLFKLETKQDLLEQRFKTMIDLYMQAMTRMNDIDRRVSERVGSMRATERFLTLFGGMISGAAILFEAFRMLHVSVP